MPKAWARPRGFRGESALRPTLERNDRALSAHISGYVVAYEDDGASLSLRGDLTLPGSIVMAAGQTVDEVDVSAHTHDGTTDGGSLTDHGNALGLGDDDHTQYLNTTRHAIEHSGVRASRTTDVTISNNTWTAIAWTVEAFDTDGFHSNGTNPSRFTVQDTGLHLVGANTRWAGGAADTGRRAIRLAVNGTSAADQISVGNNGTSTTMAVGITTLLSLTAGDYVEAEVLQSSGSNQDIAGSGSIFWMVRLG